MAEIMDAWKCYECTYIASEGEFGRRGDRVCPKCSSEDVFPLRLYKAIPCGHVADQSTWFPEGEMDFEPTEVEIQALEFCVCEDCDQQITGLERVPTQVPE